MSTDPTTPTTDKLCPKCGNRPPSISGCMAIGCPHETILKEGIGLGVSDTHDTPTTGKHIGFTGTQVGMTEAQRAAVAAVFEKVRPDWFHHGDCVGADAEAHGIARQYGCRIISHPPVNPSKRAFLKVDAEQPPLDYLARNQAIVEASIGIIAAPKGAEELRSGTWSTVRYARQKGRPVVIVYPSGETCIERR